MEKLSAREYPIKNSLTYPSGRVEIAWARSENTQQKIKARIREMRDAGISIEVKTQSYHQWNAEEEALKQSKEGKKNG